jgi:N-acyl-D-aspartate/D-glutamate deacylase
LRDFPNAKIDRLFWIVCDSSAGCLWFCTGSPATRVTIRRAHQERGEGSSIAPVNDRLIQEAALQARHFGVSQDWRTLADYFSRLEARSRPAINLGTFVGAGGIRNYVIGKDDRPATAAELERMKQLVAEAIRKMTSKAADRVHLHDRGLLRPGMMADITIFDPATIRDVSTFVDPTHYSVGIKHVFVNGRAVVSNGAITKERPGQPMRGPGYRGNRG